MARAALVVVVLAALLLVADVAFVVQETEQVIITEFGKPKGGPIDEPGLHFKLPLIRKVHRFEKRFLEWDGRRDEITTKDKRFIWVDTYARWRITDPLQYYRRLRDEFTAQSRLNDILNDATREAVANHNLVELVRTSNREPVPDESQPEDTGILQQIGYGRIRIREEILDAAKDLTQELGIEVLDIQFKRINYVEVVQEEVYDRMIAERRRIADRLRSEGEGESARILGEMERELKRIESEAFRTAEEIRGRADAEATGIYAAVYDRSADSRNFYDFLKSMETLQQTASEETTILISTESELYRFLKGSS